VTITQTDPPPTGPVSVPATDGSGTSVPGAGDPPPPAPVTDAPPPRAEQPVPPVSNDPGLSQAKSPLLGDTPSPGAPDNPNQPMTLEQRHAIDQANSAGANEYLAVLTFLAPVVHAVSVGADTLMNVLSNLAGPEGAAVNYIYTAIADLAGGFGEGIAGGNMAEKLRQAVGAAMTDELLNFAFNKIPTVKDNQMKMTLLRAIRGKGGTGGVAAAKAIVSGVVNTKVSLVVGETAPW